MGTYFALQEELSEIARGLMFKNGIRYMGRRKRQSPAVGSPKVHAKEFAALMFTCRAESELNICDVFCFAKDTRLKVRLSRPQVNYIKRNECEWVLLEKRVQLW